MPALYNRVVELKDKTVQAFWKGIVRLDKTVSPYPTFRKLHSHTFKLADFFLPFNFAWAVACVAIVRYFQAQPFPLLSAFETTILVAVGLSIPMVSQFILPATGIIVYIWTLYWVRFFPGSYSISLPFHLSTLSYPLLSFVMWLFGPSHCVQFFSSLTGYTNVMVAMTYIALGSTWVPPARLPFSYETIFAGLNTGLQTLFLGCFFPQHPSFTALFCVSCFLHGGLQEKLGFLLGVGAAVKCFLYFLPDDFRKNYETSALLSSLFSSNAIHDLEKRNHEVQDNAVAAVPVEVIESPHENCIDVFAGTQASTFMLSTAPQDIVVAPSPPCQMNQAGENATGSDLKAIRPRHLSFALENLSLTSPLPYQLGKDGTTVTDVLEAIETKLPSTPLTNPLATVAPSQYPEEEGIGPLPAVQPFLVVTNQERNPDEDHGRINFPQSVPQESKPVGRRRSVLGPREHQKSKTFRRSLDVNLGRPRRQLPTPPHLPNQAANVTSFPRPFFSSPAVQARWNDDLFEVLECLGESSSRITHKVREKRSRLCYVRKTFYPCQTSGDNIKMALLKLIDCQEDGGASLNVVRCYGAYLSDNISEGVRGIFEFCEEGSLRSIGSTIARRGGIVGEKIAGRLAEGVSENESIPSIISSCLMQKKIFTDASRSQLSPLPGYGASQCPTEQCVRHVAWHCQVKRTRDPRRRPCCTYRHIHKVCSLRICKRCL